MTGSRPEPDADDMDPTGVRALLANLPDPGPMPPELVARISHSLELEQQRRTTGAAGAASGSGGGHPVEVNRQHGHAEPTDSAHTDPAHTDPEHTDAGPPDLEHTETGTPGAAQDRAAVVSLSAERARRRPGRTVLWLGGAAAVAMVATLSVNQLMGGEGDSGVSAQYPGSTDSAGVADADAGLDAGAEAGADEGAQDDAAEAPAAEESEQGSVHGDDTDGASSQTAGEDEISARTPVIGLQGTVVLTSTGWADQVSALLASDPAERDLGDAGANCLAAASDVRTDDVDHVMLSAATWDEESARLLVAVNTDERVAWVLSADCGQTLSGPVTLTP